MSGFQDSLHHAGRYNGLPHLGLWCSREDGGAAVEETFRSLWGRVGTNTFTKALFQIFHLLFFKTSFRRSLKQAVICFPRQLFDLDFSSSSSSSLFSPSSLSAPPSLLLIIHQSSLISHHPSFIILHHSPPCFLLCHLLLSSFLLSFRVYCRLVLAWSCVDGSALPMIVAALLSLSSSSRDFVILLELVLCMPLSIS